MQGDSLINIINAVKLYNTQHPSEIIILDFNHWDNTNAKLIPEMQTVVFNYLLNSAGVNKIIASRKNYSTNNKINDFWANNKAIIIASTANPDNKFDYIWHSVNSSNFQDCNKTTDICSYWYNQQDFEKLQNNMAKQLKILQTQKHDYLFVFQAQVTPNDATIIKSLESHTKSHNLLELTGTYINKLYNFLLVPHKFKNTPGSIVIQDFTNGIDLTAWALMNF